MTTYLEDEASAEQSRPIEFYDIAIGATTHRFTSGNRDAINPANGLIYTAIPSARAEIAKGKLDALGQLEISIPVDHPIVSRWFAAVGPPRRTIATVYRMQEVSGVYASIWTGDVTSIACDADVARMLVSTMLSITDREVAVIAGQLCQHVLYDVNCGIVTRLSHGGGFSDFMFETTIISIVGRDITVDMLADHGDDWSVGGLFTHAASGEYSSIRTQTDVDPSFSTVAVLSLADQISGMSVGDTVYISAGCDHTIETCHSKFDNRFNFGGFPQMPHNWRFSPEVKTRNTG